MPKLTTRGASTLLIILIILAGLSLIPILQNAKKTVPPAELPPVRSNPIRPTPKTTDKGVHTVDGTRELIIERESASGNSAMYSVFVADVDGSNKKLIFTKTVAAGITITIPPNSWSPDNKYVFLEENATDGIHALVLKADGTAWNGGVQYLDAKVMFEEKVKRVTYDRATGWASPTLIIITTKNPDNTKGPSFWFEIGSNAFLQLRS